MNTPSAGNAPFQRNNTRRACLTATQVLEIRKLYARSAVTQGQLSRDFGVSVVQIGRIVRGEVWQGLGPVEATNTELADSARRMLELQQELDAGLVLPPKADAAPRKAPVSPLDELTPEAEERLKSFRDVAE